MDSRSSEAWGSDAAITTTCSVLNRFDPKWLEVLANAR
jgi:hypothetical protein